jgi:hypothetical protein
MRKKSFDDTIAESEKVVTSQNTLIVAEWEISDCNIITFYLIAEKYGEKCK